MDWFIGFKNMDSDWNFFEALGQASICVVGFIVCLIHGMIQVCFKEKVER